METNQSKHRKDHKQLFDTDKMWSDMVRTHRRIQDAQIPERDAQVCNKLMLVHLDHSTARHCSMDRQHSEI